MKRTCVKKPQKSGKQPSGTKNASKPSNKAQPVTLRRVRRWTFRGLAAVIILPLVLTVIYAVVPPVSTLMLARYAQLLWVDRQWRSIDEISPHLVRSVITSEDSSFCEHGGVDWSALEKQIDTLVNEGEAPRGASTLTMQTAKNLFLWNGRSYIRKGLELPLALMIDGVLTKRRIMEIYLNIAEWGEGIFGAEAAAQAWFGKSAKDLTRVEAARLATALPNPLGRNPAKPSSGHRKLAATNLARIRSAGPIFDCVLKP
ncbi:monofunctional biosynthetic peptidoglycan transglycosylase [Roseibium aggregatum]|uniref:Biosynthetic peptidoglycan transglycosylase n=1 Tax=Roseibium aggregatum TaxID=187304 RepID=A0A926S4L3_9HYPH|nr:monofunctional biosynthetic peptidoglycan transglycosylase [Roseibium aggregatum]